jgi:alkanesulfonate monooxygenase SsuD/methylene tetrahydromethanopterin reductase-like flavin-dependent oxidoreductase (luciferase family)
LIAIHGLCKRFDAPGGGVVDVLRADHHTKGRVGWNIVTSYLESGAENISEGGLRKHTKRYEVAAEYVAVLYKLFEGSWEDGAVVDRSCRTNIRRPAFAISTRLSAPRSRQTRSIWPCRWNV